MWTSIAETPQPDPATFQIEPQSEAEWTAVIAQLDEGSAETQRDPRGQLSVSVGNDKIVGVNVYHVMSAEVVPRYKEHMFDCVHGVQYAALARVSKNIIFQKGEIT